MSQKSIPTVWVVITILVVLAVIGFVYYRHLGGGPTMQRIQPPPDYFGSAPGK
ncbi:MAG: hypothetical protein ACUVTY_10770 [Armatimonadota bacterium]